VATNLIMVTDCSLVHRARRDVREHEQHVRDAIEQDQEFWWWTACCHPFDSRGYFAPLGRVVLDRGEDEVTCLACLAHREE
jgi:hypothetical protein